MNIRSSIKLLLVSAAATCCALPANADPVNLEAIGSIQAFHGGGWGGNHAAEIGQQVTVDFSYNSNALVPSINNGFFIASAPIDSASITSGVLGSGINLEPNGPGAGAITFKSNIATGTGTLTVVTSAKPPSPGFTGDVFGLSFFSNGITTTINLIENTFSNGIFDQRDSGSVTLGNVSVGAATQAPEIDPASAMSALTLLAGGLAVIRARKLSKLQPA